LIQFRHQHALTQYTENPTEKNLYPSRYCAMQLPTLKMRSPLVTPSLLLLLSLTSACSRTPQPGETTEFPSPLSFPSPLTPASPSASSGPGRDPFVEAGDIAQGAIALTQSAVSSEDWQMVVGQWERAIALLEAIPDSEPRKTLAQEKLVGYRENLAYAQEQAQKKEQPPQPPSSTLPPTEVSMVRGSPSENESEDSPKVALAKHLSNVGAKMYSTADCEKCQEQREMFAEAFSQVTEVECSATSSNSPSDPCRKAGVKTFPSWEVKGQFYSGVRSLEELADFSQYEGDRNFSQETETRNPEPAGNSQQ
jgi:hypothetical protein